MQNCPENECFFGISFLSQKSESTFLSQKTTFLVQKTTFLVQKSFRQIMDSFTSVLLSFSILKKNNTIVFSMKSIISRFLTKQMEIGTIFWLLHRKIRPINTMDREKVSELIHNAESQATRMAENG